MKWDMSMFFPSGGENKERTTSFEAFAAIKLLTSWVLK
jgi:hypothetical protein